MIEQVLNFAPLVWAALWLLHAWAAPTKQGSANETSMLWIKRAKTEEMWDGTLTRFAYVQEKGEFRVYKIGAVMVGSIISLCLFLAFDMAPEIFAILSLFGFAAGELLVRQFPQIDYAGHGAEIKASFAEYGPGKKADEYRKRETDSVRRQHTRTFKEAERRLAEWDWLADIVFKLGKGG